MSMLRRFASDREGGVLPIFAVSILPLFGLMGAAIDYSRAAALRTDMQSAPTQSRSCCRRTPTR